MHKTANEHLLHLMLKLGIQYLACLQVFVACANEALGAYFMWSRGLTDY